MRKSKVYISMPISNYDLNERKAYARETKEKLQAGYPEYEFITPFDVCIDTGKTYAQCMGKCIEILIGCDIIILERGWENSKGCQAERAVAEVYGIRII